MKTIKPFKLGILAKTFELDRKHYFVPTILALCDFGPAPRLIAETEMWKLVGAVFGKDAILDECMPKQRGEVIVHGRCFTANGTPRTAASVRVRLGTVDKTLYVVGDRVWRADGTASDPVPFTEMPVDFEHAFGGEGYAQNPRGIGFVPVRDGAREFHPLPNIEDPKRLIKGKGDRPMPASFMPIDVTWPQRWSKIGTYDMKWVREQLPGFARDMDLSMWNVTAPDQQIDGFFAGDEELRVENMHPTRPSLVGRLPGVVARCFVTQRRVDGDVFREIPMRLDTVTLIPQFERCILAFRGLTEVAEEDHDDIIHLMVACDKKGEERPVEHYRAVLGRRLDPKRESIEALRDQDLVPTFARGKGDRGDVDQMAELAQSEFILHKRMAERARREYARIRERVIAMGGDPDQVPPPEPIALPQSVDLEDLAEALEKQQTASQDVDVKAEQAAAKAEQSARESFARHGMSLDAETEKMRKQSAGPPKFSADAELQRLRDIQQLCANANVSSPELDAALSDPSTEQRLRAAEAQQREAYRIGAHLAVYRPERLVEPARSELRARIMAAHAAGTSMARQDFCGADLSGLDLRGADLRGAYFENAVLTSTSFAGAQLEGAVFAGADLSDADLTDANLAAANLGASRAHRAKLGRARLERAILDKVDLSHACLQAVRLEGVVLTDAVLEAADLQGAAFDKCIFKGNHLARASFRGCRFEHALFLDVDLTEAEFTGAILESTSFMRTRLDRAIFVSAAMSKCRMLERPSCIEADFKGATIAGATLRETDFTRADFSGATLNSSDLSKAILCGARFYRAVGKNALFMRADLSGASLVAADLEGAIFLKAKVARADFTGANLARADFMRAVGDRNTKFTDALLRDVRAVPKVD